MSNNVSFGDHSIFINDYEIYNDNSDGGTKYVILKDAVEVASRAKLNKAVQCCENNDFSCKHEEVNHDVLGNPFYCCDCGSFLR